MANALLIGHQGIRTLVRKLTSLLIKLLSLAVVQGTDAFKKSLLVLHTILQALVKPKLKSPNLLRLSRFCYHNPGNTDYPCNHFAARAMGYVHILEGLERKV